MVAVTPLQTDAEFESLVLAYWSAREPGADEVTFTVRRAGEVVRYVVLRAGSARAELRAVTPAVPPAGGSTRASSPRR